MTPRPLLAALLLVPAPAGAAPLFVDRAPGFGFAHAYAGGWEHFVGGGVAVLDCNGDRFPDLYVAGGEAPARLLVNRTAGPGAPLAFEDTTPPELALTGVTGAYPLDVDSDGRLDLAVLRVGRNRLMAGGAACRFHDASEALRFDGGDHWTTAFSATWENGNALPTLAFGNYVDRDDPDGPFGACDVNELHRPGPEGYGAPLILAPGFCPLSMLFSDWNRAGHQDLRISNDRHYYLRDGQEQMWRLDPVPHAYTEAEGWRAMSIWGMGIASRDITGDGLADMYLTSMGDQLLQYRDAAAAGPVWRDAPFATGAAAHVPYRGDDGRPSTGWHAQFGDVDNDGLDDLFVAKGNVDQMPENAAKDPNNLLMQRLDGSFAEAGAEAGLASTARSRGAALVDLNLDGRLDVVVVNRRAALEVHENVGAGTGNWLQVEVAQDGPNTALVGFCIEVRGGGRLWTREVTVGGGHAGGQAGLHHFGLGGLNEVEMRIVAPDGTASPWQAVVANRIVRATRAAGSGEVTVGTLATTR
jgi:enediyne biosynthesis protein E4